MAYNSKLVGLGSSSKMAKTRCESVGPGGVAGSNTSTTTGKGYEGSRTTGLRKSYKESGSAKNAKA